MKNGKTLGPNDTPVEAWKCLGYFAENVLTKTFNQLLDGKQMPEEWKKITPKIIFKNKGAVQNWCNFGGVKQISHSMNIWERVMKKRLRKEMKKYMQQYGFMP